MENYAKNILSTYTFELFPAQFSHGADINTKILEYVSSCVVGNIQNLATQRLLTAILPPSPGTT